MLCRCAKITISRRLSTPSLAKIEVRWWPTVVSVIDRRPPICLFLSPSPTSAITSRSRAVSVAMRVASALSWPGLAHSDLVEHACQHGAVEPDFAGVDFLDRLEQHLGRLLFEHQAQRPPADRLAVPLGIAHTGQDQHARLAGNGAQPRQKIEATLGAEIEVEQNNIGLFARREREGVGVVRGLAHHHQLLPALDQQAQPGSNHRVIFDQQDTDALYRHGCHRLCAHGCHIALQSIHT